MRGPVGFAISAERTRSMHFGWLESMHISFCYCLPFLLLSIAWFSQSKPSLPFDLVASSLTRYIFFHAA
jgi:hypothetical protein